jgi:hypothetical protein
MILNVIRRTVGTPLLRRARLLAREFLEQTNRADAIQRERLLALVARNAESQFGRDHGFGAIRSPANFRRRVPIRGYEGHEPYIEQVRRGDVQALFGPNTDVLMFAMTSGTKALTGHSDILLGAVSVRDPALAEDHVAWRVRTGSILGPFEAWLAHP